MQRQNKDPRQDKTLADLADLVSSGDWPMIDTFREKLTESLRYYYCVGGMPESVVTFVEPKVPCIPSK